MSMIGYVKLVNAEQGKVLTSDPKAAEAACQLSSEDEKAGHGLYLDKAWDGIDFLFHNGKRSEFDDAANFLGAKGAQSLEADFGYGPAAFIPPKEVSRIARALTAISDEELSARCVACHEVLIDQMVYPFSIQETAKEVEDYVAPYFKQLKALFVSASEAGDAVIFWLM